MSAQEWKEKGNNYLKSKDYDNALSCYTEAINADPSDHIHYSNRSVCFYNMGKYDKALEDANTCISTKPDWAKGYLRKAMAEVQMDNYDDAEASYTRGLELEPSNQQLKDGLSELQAKLKNPMTKNYNKLFTDPRTSKYMSDPQFKNLLDFAMKDQSMLMQLIGKDPRFMDVFSVLTGIDLNMMSQQAEKGKKEKDKEDLEKKKRQEEDQRKNEEEKKRREEEERYNNLSEEEKQEEIQKKAAEELKLKGNEAFKLKDYDTALEYYDKAIETYPKELTFYLNRAGCHHEKKQYDKVIEDCLHVADNTFDFQKKGRAFGRIAFAYQEQGELDKAIEYFEKSLLENNDPRVKDALKSATDLKKKMETEKYLNPELAEEANIRGNDLYKAGKYPQALEEYNESIKRNPKHAKYYSNRAACYIKLMEFNYAARDCDKAIELDPTMIKAYQRKASCHMLTKEYHKAMATYEKGMKLFPGDKELKDGYYRCMAQVNSFGDSKDDDEREKRAYSDPEIQNIIKDPRIQQLFKDLQDNPKSANDAIMKDEFIGGAFKKLVAAGIIKTK
jgi:stress-induced-phosphoprotein 1